MNHTCGFILIVPMLVCCFIGYEDQCCGSGMFIPGCLSRDVYPGSEFFHPRSRIQGPKDSGSWIRIPIIGFKFLTQKICLCSRKYDLGCSSRIRISDPYLDFIPIPDPVSGSTTLMRIFPIFCIVFNKRGGGLIFFY